MDNLAIQENLNESPITNLVDEITDVEEISNDEKEKYISQLKAAKLKYNPKKDFGRKFKAERKRKNKVVKKQRKINRK